MMNSKHPRKQAGISLIEALVALAVMAVGMLGVVGMQATLRSNSDISKQRAEAVRIGQAAIEQARAFPQLADFDAIVSNVEGGIAGYNASFTASTEVPAAVAASPPKLKTVAVNVSWTDRADQSHAVNLVSTIAGISPELAGTLGLPNDRAATQRPGGRSVTIPAAAVDQGNGSSVFTPPNSGGVTWTFNNTTGFITSVCVPSSPCVATGHFLLSGFIRFATGDEPDPAEGEQPVDTLIPVGVEVDVTLPAASTEVCFTQNIGTTAVAYYCAVPTPTAPHRWSGHSRLTGLSIAPLAGTADDQFKVCRYTPVAGCHPAVGDPLWGVNGSTASCTGPPPTPSRQMTNAEHPLNYADVGTSLTQQNFLVISAGDGTNRFDCPQDGPLDFINSNTYRHQPPS